MPDTTVKCFLSTMNGAPSITRAAGTILSVLDACLVDGFGSVTLDSLVVSGDVATGTKSAGHNFAKLGAVGPVIRIAGATPSALNGDWRIDTIPNSTTFTFQTAGISNQTATGTITAKRAPLGFTKAFSGTNIAAYRSATVGGCQAYLRVDDTSTQAPVITGYMTMSDVNTGTDAFPSSALYLYKIDGTRASAPWAVFGDDRSFYISIQTNFNGIWSGGMFFGDLANPVMSSDAFYAGIIGGVSAGNTNLLDLSNTTNAALARSYTQLAGAVSLYRYSHSLVGSVAYPCPVNNGLIFVGADAWQSGSLPRGVMPGMYRLLNTYSGIPDMTVYDNVDSAGGRSLMYKLGASNGAAFDITGPWR